MAKVNLEKKEIFILGAIMNEQQGNIGLLERIIDIKNIIGRKDQLTMEEYNDVTTQEFELDKQHIQYLINIIKNKNNFTGNQIDVAVAIRNKLQEANDVKNTD